MEKKLILVDGLPGTGKSTLSQEISFQYTIYNYVQKIEGYMNGLGGVVFYLIHDDITELWKNTVTKRGIGFSSIVSHYIENTKFIKKTITLIQKKLEISGATMKRCVQKYSRI
jgi:hypothetical protein